MRLLPLVLFGLFLRPAPGAELFSTDIDGTLAAAKKAGKPLLIDFYGIWCPPCNELEETVFETPDFHAKAKAFALLKVDADAPASWKIKDRYRVGGYPTVVFANADGNEIFRVVGYRSPREFLRTMDLVLAAKNQDLDKSCKSRTAEALWRCALVCTERKDQKCAEAAYEKLETKLKPSSVRYQLARAYTVEVAPNPELKRDGYERLLAEFSDSPAALLWSGEYLALFEGDGTAAGSQGPKKPLLEKVLSHFPQMQKDSRLEELGLAPTDLLEARAELLQGLGRADEAKAAWKDAAEALEKASAGLSSEKPERGYTLERIECLESAGDLEGALKLAGEYRQKYPEEFTFHYVAAGILQREKKFNDALPIARRAFELSYGDNQIRVATLLIGLLATIPDRAGAKQVYEQVKASYKPDAKLEVRTHRYLKKMDEAWQKFPAVGA